MPSRISYLRFLPLCVALLACVVGFAEAIAADFDFYGRSGDAIAIDFGSLPGVAPGATFSSLSPSGFNGHRVYTSSFLGEGNFTTDGRLWVMANPAFDGLFDGDQNLNAAGFQGTLEGSLDINGTTKTFSVTVQPGYTGAGAGAVQQSFERLGGSGNDPLFVAQQQQRLKYFGYKRIGGTPISVTGSFDLATDQALQTFQGAFDGGFNSSQSSPSADGIVGPTTAAWLNAANAPQWRELIDPDPQRPGSFTVGGMIGDFDILPAPDSGTGIRSGRTPQTERFGTTWAIDLFEKGSAAAKQATGQTQLMNGMSTDDGYGSAAFHSTHLVGLDVDIHVDASTWNFGNSSVSTAEQGVIDHAIAFMTAADTTGVSRIITSNRDILNGINAFRPGSAIYDSSGGHRNHLHLDVDIPNRLAGVANLPGDFNLDDVVDAADYTVWRKGLGSVYTEVDFRVWRSNYVATQNAIAAASATVPEPATLLLLIAVAVGGMLARCR